MRAVVTGAAGFLGSHLCERLIGSGYQVIGVDNLLTGSNDNVRRLQQLPAFTFVRHDISERLDVASPVDAVLHFASPASPVDYLKFPIETLKVGSVGTHNALGLARAKGARFLLASTSEIYGDPAVHPQPESYWGHVNSIGPRAVYDEAKRFAEAITMAYRRDRGVDTRIVRIFNTYGPRMRADDGRVVSNFVVQALRGDALTVYGDGTQTRSFCYVDDLIEGILLLLDRGGSEPVNIGNPTEFTVAALADIVVRLTGSSSKVVLKPLPVDDPRQRCPDISRAKAVLGWQPRTPLEDGVPKTIAYFREVLRR